MNARVSRETKTDADSTEESKPHKGTCHNLLVLLSYRWSLSWVYKADCLEPGREKTAKRQKKKKKSELCPTTNIIVWFLPSGLPDRTKIDTLTGVNRAKGLCTMMLFMSGVKQEARREEQEMWPRVKVARIKRKSNEHKGISKCPIC